MREQRMSKKIEHGECVTKRKEFFFYLCTPSGESVGQFFVHSSHAHDEDKVDHGTGKRRDGLGLSDIEERPK